MKSKIVALALGVCALVSLPLVAKADSLTYSFTYTGTGVYIGNETASGSGSFTISFDKLGDPTLTAFSFSDTLIVPKSSGSTFTYSLADLSSESIVLGGTLADPFLANLQIQTKAETGTDNSDYGPASFGFAYASANPAAGNTLGTSGAFLDDFTTGNVVLGQPTLTPTVPEPASYALLATGLVGIAFLFRRTQKVVPTEV